MLLFGPKGARVAVVKLSTSEGEDIPFTDVEGMSIRKQLVEHKVEPDALLWVSLFSDGDDADLVSVSKALMNELSDRRISAVIAVGADAVAALLPEEANVDIVAKSRTGYKVPEGGPIYGVQNGDIEKMFTIVDEVGLTGSEFEFDEDEPYLHFLREIAYQ